MAKCELRIKLDRPDPTYKAGEKVRGAVEVNAFEDCECRGLTLAPGWRTEGKGNTDEEGLHSLTLHAGAWQAGQTASYPFEFDAPFEPLTYQGKLFSIHWSLRATANIPHAIDAKVEETFVLAPGELKPLPDDETDDEEGATQISESLEFTVPPRVALGIAIASVLLGIFLAWSVYGAVHEGRRWRDLYTLMACGAFGSLMFGAGGIWHATRYLMLEKKLGPVEFNVAPASARRGEAIGFTIRFRPQSEIEVQDAELKVVAQEFVERGSGKNRRTLKETVYEQSLTLASDRRVMSGEGVILEGKFQIPPDAPCSVSLGANWLDWKLIARLNLRHWPDWTKELPLDVSP